MAPSYKLCVGGATRTPTLWPIGLIPMKTRYVLPLILLAAWIPRATAQHYVLVKDGEKMSIVVAADNVSPLVLHGDKLEIVHATKFALGEGGEYLPKFVAIRNPDAKTSSISMDGHEINKEFQFKCELETDYSLKHVFVVIVLHLRGDAGLFLFEVGDLEPRSPKPFHVIVPMNMTSELGHYDLYLFSGGRELFHSMMGTGNMEAALNRMVFDRIKGVAEAEAQPFLGPTPEYPKALYRKRVAGNATVSFKIDRRGRVEEAAVASASLPEFGEAALAAIRQWRFLPGVKHGRAVESRAQMPFNFTPSKD
jgi:TonB family protein